MAVDYSQYVGSYAGKDYSGATKNIGQGIGGLVAGSILTPDEKLANAWSSTFDDIFGDYANVDIASIGDLSLLSADDAYLKWSTGLDRRTRKQAQKRGLLNPAAFRVQYDKHKIALAGDLSSQLDVYKRFYKKNNRDMSEFLDSRPNMRKLLMANAPLTDPVTGGPNDLINYVNPQKRWWKDKALGEKALTVGAPIAGGLYGRRVLKDIKAKGGRFKGLKARYSPFGKKRVTQLTEKGAKDIGKALSPGIKKGAATKLASSNQKKSTIAYNKAEKLYNKNELAKLRKKQPRGKIAQSKIKGIKGFEKTKIGSKLLNTKQASIVANKAAKKKISGAPAKAVVKYLQKHGASSLIRKVIKKVGWKGAAKLLGKGALSLGLKGTGVGAAASLLIDASTIYTLYSIITSED